MVAISGSFGSFNALMNLKKSEEGRDNTILRLSNGERIQRVEEDVSGMSISNNLRSEIKALRETRRAHFDGISSIQLADGQLEEVSTVLARISELATQAASTTHGTDNGLNKQALDVEYQQLLADIDQLNSNLRFNEITLFGSTGSTLLVNTDPDVTQASDQISITFSSFSTSALGMAGTDVLTTSSASTVLITAATALDAISRQRGRLGAMQKRLELNLGELGTRMEHLQAIETGIRETNIPEETVNLTKFDILNRSSLSVLAQTGLEPDRVFQLLN